ncbi:MAG: hypothetical protein EZS28_021937 [Streblomastix strix]|uniref:ISXO2-like transposase domain-containing protein n=1 Tax=Streblomastix strix TaxID=222440 RepID=A0A5J4VJC0_9EUKA|nr:MAG: hypothetical protein EZS28_021937 [Streblomastix strix]
MKLISVTQPLEKKIGGENDIVEIDEAIVRRRKWRKGRGKEQIWIFGGFLRETEENKDKTKRMFILIIPNRSAITLFNCVNTNIIPKTLIYSDSWKGYSKIPEGGYKNDQVNHKYNFVKPGSPEVHTQHIESTWSSFRKFMKRSSPPSHKLELYINEFLFWKQYTVNGVINFIVVFKLLSQFNSTIIKIMQNELQCIEKLEKKLDQREKLVRKACRNYYTHTVLSDIEEHDLKPQNIQGDYLNQFESDELRQAFDELNDVEQTAQQEDQIPIIHENLNESIEEQQIPIKLTEIIEINDDDDEDSDDEENYKDRQRNYKMKLEEEDEVENEIIEDNISQPQKAIKRKRMAKSNDQFDDDYIDEMNEDEDDDDRQNHSNKRMRMESDEKQKDEDEDQNKETIIDSLDSANKEKQQEWFKNFQTYMQKRYERLLKKHYINEGKKVWMLSENEKMVKQDKNKQQINEKKRQIASAYNSAADAVEKYSMQTRLRTGTITQGGIANMFKTKQN